MKERQDQRLEYSSPLRQRQAELTQTLILEAVNKIVAEGRIQTFTMHEVAKRAGVSYASLYRHFPSRELLLEGLYDWGQSLFSSETGSAPDTLEKVPEWIRATTALFEKHKEAVVSFGIVQRALSIYPSKRRQRDDVVARLIAEATPHLSEREQKKAFATIRYLVSADAWSAFRFRFNLDENDTGDALFAAVKTIIDDLKSREREAMEVASTSRDDGNEPKR